MNMSLAEIERQLKSLRLNAMIATLDTRIIQANQDASFTEVFACLVQDELDYRKSRGGTSLTSREKATASKRRHPDY